MNAEITKEINKLLDEINAAIQAKPEDNPLYTAIDYLAPESDRDEICIMFNIHKKIGEEDLEKTLDGVKYLRKEKEIFDQMEQIVGSVVVDPIKFVASSFQSVVECLTGSNSNNMKIITLLLVILGIYAANKLFSRPVYRKGRWGCIVDHARIYRR